MGGDVGEREGFIFGEGGDSFVLTGDEVMNDASSGGFNVLIGAKGELRVGVLVGEEGGDNVFDSLSSFAFTGSTSGRASTGDFFIFSSFSSIFGGDF